MIIILGARVTLSYESAAGNPATPPTEWPFRSSVTRPQNKYTLVMFAHPECPCTRASLSELEIVMTRIHGSASAFVLFTKPDTQGSQMEDSATWTKASRIPGVSVRADEGARETGLFNAHVSGQTLLYDPDGRLVFVGGITASRGHEGDNAGVDAVIGLVQGAMKGLLHAPVFGCSLQNPSAQELQESGSWKKP